MLLFIHRTESLWRWLYRVSIHLMLLFIWKRLLLHFLQIRFNTSHVTLYHHDKRCFFRIWRFQYISCYSLSQMRLRRCISTNGFNTSHVTLYQTWSGWKRDSISVSIHLMLLFILTPGDQCVSDKCVSIHLMLLFISGILCTALAVASFQYISYYSLSDSCKWRQILYHVSIHLMLLFIQHRDGILPAR